MDTWTEYTGKCEKVFYDLKLKNGRFVSHCWPWNGNFNPVDGSGDNYIEGYRVEFIRICDQQWDWTNPPSAPTIP